MLVVALSAVPGKPEVVRHIRHLPRGEGETGGHHMVTDVHGQHPLRLPGGQQGQHVLHRLGGPPVAQVPAVDDLLAKVQRLGGKEVQQQDLEGPVGVGDVVDAVEDAPELLNDLLRKRREDQFEAQLGSAIPLWLKVDSASVNQERVSSVQKGGSFTLVGATCCWAAARVH